MILLRFLTLIGIAYAVVVAALYVFQAKLIFQPESLSAAYTFAFPGSFEERNVRINGLPANSLLFRVPNARGSILYFHGNAGSLKSWGITGAELARHTGFNIWIMDYPGYGKSSGSINSEAQLHAFAKQFYDTARRELPGPLVIYGRSIGTGVAVRVASEHAVDGLILESPYYGVRELAAELLPWIPGVAVRFPLPSHTWIADVHSPILMMHGDDDEVIPFAQGRRLAAAAPAATFVAIPGGHHNDLADFKMYWRAIDEFISRVR